MLFKELKEKDETGLKYSEGHDSGGVRAIQMVLQRLKEDGFLNPVEKENYETYFMDEWEKVTAYGLGKKENLEEPEELQKVAVEITRLCSEYSERAKTESHEDLEPLWNRIQELKNQLKEGAQ